MAQTVRDTSGRRIVKRGEIRRVKTNWLLKRDVRPRSPLAPVEPHLPQQPAPLEVASRRVRGGRLREQHFLPAHVSVRRPQSKARDARVRVGGAQDGRRTLGPRGRAAHSGHDEKAGRVAVVVHHVDVRPLHVAIPRPRDGEGGEAAAVPELYRGKVCVVSRQIRSKGRRGVMYGLGFAYR